MLGCFRALGSCSSSKNATCLLLREGRPDSYLKAAQLHTHQVVSACCAREWGSCMLGCLKASRSYDSSKVAACLHLSISWQEEG